jgi:hypothetical protein
VYLARQTWGDSDGAAADSSGASEENVVAVVGAASEKWWMELQQVQMQVSTNLWIYFQRHLKILPQQGSGCGMNSR